MTDNVYKVKQLKSPSFLQKILKIQPKDNAVTELNNLLASKPLKDISINDISLLNKKYKVNLFKFNKESLINFYKIYLTNCLSDKILTQEEIEKLKHLKDIFNLNDNDIEEVHENMAGAIYRQQFSDLLSDGNLDESEIKFLEKLETDLKLSQNTAKSISAELRENFIIEFLDAAISDERLSEEEEFQLEQLCKNLNVEFKIGDNTKELLSKYKLLWVIENKELPAIVVDINLQKNEICYFSTNIEWFEQRTITKKINYSGVSTRIKIVKGVYYRVGNITPQRITSEELKLIDQGVLYLTNKRLIFLGGKKNTNIKLDKILSFTPYINGVEIQKDAGKIPFIKFETDIDIFSLILSKLLRES